MTIVRPIRIGLTLLAATLGLAAGATAQTNDEIFPQFQWNFSTPGARANGMGRSFIGVADDATATVTNPAGLSSLTKPQVYVEYKNTSIKVDRLANIDSWLSAAHTPTQSSTNVNAISFFNVSAPVNGRMAVGFTYHQFLNYQETFQLQARPIPDINHPGTIVAGGFTANPVQGSADFKGTSFAGSVGYAVNDQLRVGVTVSANHLDAQASAARLGINFLPGFPGVPTAVSSSSITKNQTSINDTNNAFGAAFGLLYRANDNVSIGFDYTKSPKFKINEDFQVNPGFVPNPCCGTNQTLVSFAGFPKPISINVPDHFGVGVSVRPMPKLLIAADIVRINYSSLAKDFTIVLDFDNADVTPDKFSVKDSTEVHLGAEYNVIQGMNPVFLRAGLYTNPNHVIEFSPTIPDNTNNSFYNAVYNLLQRDTEVKGTFGAGIAIGPRLQVDLAYIWNKEFVASTAVRF